MIFLTSGSAYGKYLHHLPSVGPKNLPLWNVSQCPRTPTTPLCVEDLYLDVSGLLSNAVLTARATTAKLVALDDFCALWNVEGEQALRISIGLPL